ncbi:Fe3+ dicitrate ABC transporter permease [Yersinia pestis]|uniref:Fe3+ dicitrate ABC transporter permease n=1 Tax=Yersinia pestis TaxID=632 RepID=UPI00092E32D7|nr:Fe3+ dicitrate ABC transporter permease [Yersinia pestis]NSL63677.1 Fe3+ dicitrate ABC transporter permease [Yersinia pestis]
MAYLCSNGRENNGNLLEPITQGRQSFQQLHLRRGLFTLALIGSLLAAMVIDLATGAANLSPLDVLRLFLVDSSQHDELHQIIFGPFVCR